MLLLSWLSGDDSELSQTCSALLGKELREICAHHVHSEVCREEKKRLRGGKNLVAVGYANLPPP